MILKTARRVVITVVGFTVLLLGVVLLATPGPATVVIPIGLAILATEFVWAQRLLAHVKARAVAAKNAVFRRNDVAFPCCTGDPPADNTPGGCDPAGPPDGTRSGS